MCSGEWETADFQGCCRGMIRKAGGYLGQMSRMKEGAVSQVAKETHIRVIHSYRLAEAGTSHRWPGFPPSGAKSGHSHQGWKGSKWGQLTEGPRPHGRSTDRRTVPYAFSLLVMRCFCELLEIGHRVIKLDSFWRCCPGGAVF